MRSRGMLGIKVIVTLGCVVAVAYATDWSELGSTLAAVLNRPLLVTGALAVYAGGFVLRAISWSAVLPVPVNVRDRLRAIHAMLAVNHVLPGPVGEAVRARSVTGPTLGFSRALASVAAARLVDVVALLILGAGASVLLLPNAVLPALAGAVVLIPVGLVVGRRIGLDLSRGSLVRATAWAVPGWAAEIILVVAVASAAGIALSWAGATLGLVAAILSKAVALLPGGLGTFELAMAAGLAASGVPEVEGLTIAATTHAVLFAYAYVAGGAVLLLGYRPKRFEPQGVLP